MIEIDNIRNGAKIRVVGVGGGGGNAVNSMINRGIQGVEFISINTDLQALEKSLAPNKIQVGKNLTSGLGAGADPSVGRKAVEENREEIADILSGSDMVFITAGMGGGTGTGGAPLVANIAKSVGALVVGIVTKPFNWEGKKRLLQAEEGISEMKKNIDTLIVIPNNRLLSLIEKNTLFTEAFEKTNQILYNATRGISEVITRSGFINVDFADVRTIMKEMGDAMMGTGVGKGENRSIEAAQAAISSPLLEGVSINGAQGVLVNITGGPNLTMSDVDGVMNVIYDTVNSDMANIIFGTVIDDNLSEELYVTVIATGFNKKIESSTITQAPPQIKKIPTGASELKQYDAPAINRRSAEKPNMEKIISGLDGFQQKIDKSNPDRPAFLRKIMD
ncbi:MAG TPA: cell division protein FtsZ [Bacteroidota bacterium]|nr:cell division protein FtsZ [Bacteroidota bacterium]